VPAWTGVYTIEPILNAALEIIDGN